MKILLLSLAMLAGSSGIAAACYSWTVYSDGRIMFCTQCGNMVTCL